MMLSRDVMVADSEQLQVAGVIHLCSSVHVGLLVWIFSYSFKHVIGLFHYHEYILLFFLCVKGISTTVLG